MGSDDRLRWNQRYERLEEASDGPPAPPAWLAEIDDLVPGQGAGLDLAAGRGRLALWMARRGLLVTAVDVSGVGLRLLREAAGREHLSVVTEELDLEVDLPPSGPFALATLFFYKQEGLLARACKTLLPGGCLIAELPTVRNLERHDRPPRPYLVEANQLLDEARSLEMEVFYYREGWLPDGPEGDLRHTARLAACRPTPRVTATIR